ncbi:MAG: NitT/TauT family transport system permease protein, partial [Hyphomicrobiales bacterium]|nr:NitT/TauT family transport system permease protein [Hyphomicrobiales bacterium]
MSVPVTYIAHPQDAIVAVADGDASPPPRRFAIPEAVARSASRIGWAIASVGLFAGIWELLWFWGIADPKLLPPPHVFLGNF